MHKVTIWVEFEDLVSVGELSNKANIKLTIEGDDKKIDIVSQVDLKSGYDFEFEEPGEYCVSIEHEELNFKENFNLNGHTKNLEIKVG